MVHSSSNCSPVQLRLFALSELNNVRLRVSGFLSYYISIAFSIEMFIFSFLQDSLFAGQKDTLMFQILSFLDGTHIAAGNTFLRIVMYFEIRVFLILAAGNFLQVYFDIAETKFMKKYNSIWNWICLHLNMIFLITVTKSLILGLINTDLSSGMGIVTMFFDLLASGVYLTLPILRHFSFVFPQFSRKSNLSTIDLNISVYIFIFKFVLGVLFSLATSEDSRSMYYVVMGIRLFMSIGAFCLLGLTTIFEQRPLQDFMTVCFGGWMAQNLFYVYCTIIAVENSFNVFICIFIPCIFCALFLCRTRAQLPIIIRFESARQANAFVGAVLELLSAPDSQGRFALIALTQSHKLRCSDPNCHCRTREVYNVKQKKDLPIQKVKTEVKALLLKMLIELAESRPHKENRVSLLLFNYVNNVLKNRIRAVFYLFEIQSPLPRVKKFAFYRGLESVRQVLSAQSDSLFYGLDFKDVLSISRVTRDILQQVSEILDEKEQLWNFFVKTSTVEVNSITDQMLEIISRKAKVSNLMNIYREYLLSNPRFNFLYQFFHRELLNQESVLSAEHIYRIFSRPPLSSPSTPQEFFETCYKTYVFDGATAYIEAGFEAETLGRIEKTGGGIRPMMGYSADELEGGPLNRLLPLTFRQKHDEILEDVRKTGRLRRAESNLIGWGRRNDGSVVRLQIFLKFFLRGKELRVETLFYPAADGFGEATALADVYGFIQGVTSPLEKLSGLPPPLFEEKKIHLGLLSPEFVRMESEGFAGVEEYLKIQAEEDPLIKVNFPRSDDPRLDASDHIFHRFYAESHVLPIIAEVTDEDDDSKTPFLAQRVETSHPFMATGGGLAELRGLAPRCETEGVGLNVRIRSEVETARDQAIFVRHRLVETVGFGNRLRGAASGESFRSGSASFEGSRVSSQLEPLTPHFLDGFPDYLSSLRESTNPFHKPSEAVPSREFGGGRRLLALIGVAAIISVFIAFAVAWLFKVISIDPGSQHCDQILSIFKAYSEFSAAISIGTNRIYRICTPDSGKFYTCLEDYPKNSQLISSVEMFRLQESIAPSYYVRKSFQFFDKVPVMTYNSMIADELIRYFEKSKLFLDAPTLRLFFKSKFRSDTIGNFLQTAVDVDKDSEKVADLAQRAATIFMLIVSAIVVASGIFAANRVASFYSTFAMMSQSLQWLTLSATVMQTNYIRSIVWTFRKFFLHEDHVPLELIKPPREFDGTVRATWRGRHRKTVKLALISLAVFIAAMLITLAGVIAFCVFMMGEFAAVRENQKFSFRLIQDAYSSEVLRNIIKETVLGPRPAIIPPIYAGLITQITQPDTSPLNSTLAKQFNAEMAQPICESYMLKGASVSRVAVTNEKMTIQQFCDKFLESSIDKQYSTLKIKFASTIQSLMSKIKEEGYSKEDLLFAETLCSLLVEFMGRAFNHWNTEAKAFLSEVFVHSLLFIVLCFVSGGMVYLFVRFVSLRIWQELYTQHRSIYLHFLPWRVAKTNHQLRSIINRLKPPSN